MSKLTVDDIKITMTPLAKEQLKLILVNDYTITDQVFRLKIDGKGCNGFEYALGFTPKQSDDLCYPILDATDTLNLTLDPFTAHYCQEGEIDYVVDHENDQEGFVFTNSNEKKYRGKFFKDETMLPGSS